MTAIERIEQEIARLSPRELAQFRAWYAQFDANAWDQQIEKDAACGKLDTFADAALRAHAAGRSRPL